jgi:hypothetical protein
MQNWMKQLKKILFTQDLKSCDHCGRVGSSPTPGTYKKAASLAAFCDLYTQVPEIFSTSQYSLKILG